MVVNLSKERASRESHLSGEAVCLFCRHEWVAVAPVGALWLECPECELSLGRLRFAVGRDGLEWSCGCGNDLFHIKPEGIYCPQCGAWQEGF